MEIDSSLEESGGSLLPAYQILRDSSGECHRHSVSEEDEDEEDENDEVDEGSGFEESKREKRRNDEGFEEVKLGSEFIDLPSDFLENREILNHFFSEETWGALPVETQEHLKTFLPNFPEHDSIEKDKSLEMLFKGENFFFGNPLEKFKSDLIRGKFNPDNIKMQKLLRKTQIQIYGQRQKERNLKLLQDILVSRKSLLEAKTLMDSRTPLCVLKMEQKSVRVAPDIKSRVSKRYFTELRYIRSAAGEDGDSSEDEIRKREDSESNEDENDKEEPAKKSRKRRKEKKEINLLESDYWKKIVKSESSSSGILPDSGRLRTLDLPFKNLNPASSTSNTQYIHKMAEEPKPQLLSLPHLKAQPAPPPLEPSRVNDLTVVAEAVANIPGMIMELDPMTNDHESDTAEITRNEKSEVPLVQCYFCLLRDKFRASLDHKVTIPDLEDVIREWETNEETRKPEWIALAPDWVSQIPSAVAFLTGSFPDAQPPDFQPYVDCDPVAGTYQWIATGRDSDIQLMSLNQWWLGRRDICRAVTTGGNASPPSLLQPPLGPSPQQQQLPELPLVPVQQEISFINHQSYTTWNVRPSTEQEKIMYRLQERQRYAKPSLPFTYHIHGYTTTVGPIKGLGGYPSKAKAHALLVQDRPPFATILNLVKDAVARLPNGEGTRPDIVELLKDSQYINAMLDPQALTSAVSGALDRLQSETDPCVKYESVKKTWIYLHRGRSEAEFMRIHNEQLSMPKSALKRPKSRKAAAAAAVTTTTAITTPELPSEPLPPTSATAATASSSSVPPSTASILEAALAGLPNESKERSPDEMMLSAVQSILPTTPLEPVKTDVVQPLPPAPPSEQQQQQTIQLMTPQGLKTYQVNIPQQTTQAINKQTTVLKHSLLMDQHPLQQPTIINKPIELDYNSQTPMKKSIIVSTNQDNQQSKPVLAKFQLNNLIPSSQLQKVMTTAASQLKPPSSVLLSSNPIKIDQRQQQQLPSQQVQRVIVKNSEGKPIQLTAATLQKLFASGTLKSGLQIALPGAASKASTAPPNDKVVKSQLQQQRLLLQQQQQTVKVFQQHLQPQTAISKLNIKTPLSNNSPKTTAQVRYVQLGGSTSVSGHQLISGGNIMKIVTSTGVTQHVRVVSSSPAAAAATNAVQPNSIRLANNSEVLSVLSQRMKLPTIKVPISTNAVNEQQQIQRLHTIRLANTSLVKQQEQQQRQQHVFNPSGQHQQQQQQVVLQTTGGKPIILSQQALQEAGITNLQNVRIVQSPQSITTSASVSTEKQQTAVARILQRTVSNDS